LTFPLQNYTEFEECLHRKQVYNATTSKWEPFKGALADSLWHTFNVYFDEHINDDGSIKAHDVPPSPKAEHARLLRTNSFSEHGHSSESNHSPDSSADEANKVKSNTLLLNTWQPDGEKCHMQTMRIKSNELQSDVKVYWNKLSPPG